MSVPNALEEDEFPGLEDWKSLPNDDKKHTLDSDEEDEREGKKYEILADDDIEGQEEGAGGFDGEVQITPFNMQEEMEEGHFDTEGNYHWNKEAKLVRDNWLENIDWVKIKKLEGALPKPEESDSEESTPFDTIPTYKKMLSLMKPGEAVAKAIKRLGGSKSVSASERWRRKKAGLQEENEGNRQQMLELTEHANKLLTETGNMDVYQETYEHINSLVQEAARKHAAAHPKPKSYDDALDMYAEDFDEKEKARLNDGSKKHKLEDGESGGTSGASESKKRKLEETENGTNQGSESAETEDKKEYESDGKVMWEYKLKEDSIEISGPHSSEQMNEWMEEGRFADAVWVRKVGQGGQFYSSRRIDFELYL